MDAQWKKGKVWISSPNDANIGNEGAYSQHLRLEESLPLFARNH